MADREKVIKGVHDARRYLEDREWVDKSVGVHIDALNDALAMLKEQEAVKPDTDSEGKWYCSTCGGTVGYFPIRCSAPQKFYNFCPECGREVKWE